MIFAILATSFVSMTLISTTVGQDCPDIFQRYCSKHSYCLSPNPDCEVLAYYPTVEEIDQIIQLHNEKRSQVANGGTKLPEASNMLEMEWDYELAAVAQNYANQCIYKHDPSNCRRVDNFGVGQNLAIQRETGGHTVPQPDWEFAVNDWFAEIRNFPESALYPFEPPADGSGPGEYRHFSQLVWATTFRVGCGYVLYKEGNVFKNETYTRLYACDYGPSGNIYGEHVYETGTPCDSCPGYTCCGSQGCNNTQGLCSRTNDKAPLYPPPEPNLFYCGFRDNEDCDNYIKGNPNWVVQPTLGGNYIGIVLDGGENSTLVFKSKIQPTEKMFCVILTYRKGPTNYNDTMSSSAEQVLTIPSKDYTARQPLPGYGNPQRQQFSTYNLTLSWDLETQYAVSFSVPDGAAPQFLNIKSVLAVDGQCENTGQ